MCQNFRTSRRFHISVIFDRKQVEQLIRPTAFDRLVDLRQAFLSASLQVAENSCRAENQHPARVRDLESCPEQQAEG